MTELMTLSEYMEANGTKEMFQNSNIDSLTQDAITNHFKFRKVCDNDRFGYFFNRTIVLYSGQYNRLARMESVEIDPMVADYMERQIIRKNEGTLKTVSDVTNTTANDGNRTITTTNTHSDETDNSGTRNTTEDAASTNTVEKKGSSNDESKHTGTDTVTRTETVEGTTTATTDNTTTGTSSGSADTKNLQGMTPDSSTYQMGIPANLNWAYTSGQGEESTKDSKESSETSTGSSSGKNNSSSTGDNTTEYNNTRTDKATRTETETGNTEGKTTTDVTDNSSSQTSGEWETVQTEGNGSKTTQTNIGNNTTTDNRDEDTRERYSGRHEAPQDLLSRAWSFILRSNSFRWLIERLDNCFFSLYDY